MSSRGVFIRVTNIYCCPLFPLCRRIERLLDTPLIFRFSHFITFSSQSFLNRNFLRAFSFSKDFKIISRKKTKTFSWKFSLRDSVTGKHEIIKIEGTKSKSTLYTNTPSANLIPMHSLSLSISVVKIQG